MEQRTVSETIDILEPLLRKFENDKDLKIENAIEEPGTKVGDNYMSIVVRTKVTGKRGNGAPYAVSIMTKRYPRHRSTVKIARNAELFFNEAHVYEKILPRFGSIGPRCIYADPHEIMMEDLGTCGYVVLDRMNLLDLQHCKFTIKALAHLHARSLMLKLSNPTEFQTLVEPLIEAVFPTDGEPSLGTSIDTSFSHALKALKSIDNPDVEFSRALEFLEINESHGYKMLQDIVRRQKEKYDVLSHGDAWNNNVLFKQDNEGRIMDVKLVDFQIVRHASPGIDFHYFVYSSAKSSVIEESYDVLVECYQKFLVEELQRLGADDNVLRDLSLEWWKQELSRTAVYGLFTSFWLVNAVLAEPDETINMDEIPADFLDHPEYFEPKFRPAKIDRIKCIALHYYRTYNPDN